MSDQNLDDDNLEQHIREQAYYSWEIDGRPEGQQLNYWDRAQRALRLAASFPALDLQSLRHNYEGGISAQPPDTSSLFAPAKFTAAFREE